MFENENSEEMSSGSNEFILRVDEVSNIEQDMQSEISEETLVIVDDMQPQTFSFMEVIGKAIQEINVKNDDINASFMVSDNTSYKSVPEAKHGQFVDIKKFERINQENSSLKSEITTLTQNIGK